MKRREEIEGMRRDGMGGTVKMKKKEDTKGR
jgi:hypothetical protein